MKISHKYLLLIILFILALISSLWAYRNGTLAIKPWVQAKHIEAELGAIEPDIRTHIADEIMVSKLLTDSYTFDEFKKFTVLPYGIVVYENDSAVMWTNNSIIPVQAKINAGTAPLLITESNGSYILFRHDFGNSGISTIGFLPIQFEYGIHNKYLTNIKTEGLHVPSYLHISIRPTDFTFPVHDLSGAVIFYVSEDTASEVTANYPALLYIGFLIMGIICIILLFDIAVYAAQNFNKGVVTLLFVASLVLLFLIIKVAFYHVLFNQLELFDPHNYASSGFATSLGELVIKSILFFAFAIFFYRQFPFVNSTRINKIISVLIFVFTGWVFVHFFNGMVLDSAISFNIHNFFSLDFFSLAAFIVIAILFLSFLLIAFRCLNLIWQSKKINQYAVWILLPTIIISIIISVLRNHYEVQFIVLVALVAIVYLFTQTRRIALLSFPSLLLWLLVSSGFSALLLSKAIAQKSEENKRLYAIKKSNEKDALTEYLFNEEQMEIGRRLALQISSLESAELIDKGMLHKVFKPGLLNQFRQELQTSYFKKYDSNIFIYKDDSLLSATTNKVPVFKKLKEAIEYNGEYTASPNLYFINDNTGNYYYLADIPVLQNKVENVNVFVELIPRRYNSRSLYPELLIDDDLKVPGSFDQFNYAVYYNNNLVERSGAYSYPIMDVFYVDKENEFAEETINGYKHLVYRVNDIKKVVVSDANRTLLEPVSYFSFLFFFYLIFTFLVIGIDVGVKMLSGKIDIYKWLDTTLQNKIQVSVISLIILAFITLGVATVIYITNQYNISHRDGLLTKIEAVQTNLDLVINDNRIVNIDRKGTDAPLRKVSNRINELSEIHDMDINIYGPGGGLLVSSQPDIFNRGLISRNMNPLAFFKMTCEKETWYIQNEHIGNLKYLSAYVPVLSEGGEVMFYLNLPYFATEQNLRQEISSFLVALINVYVILLVMAGIIAYLVSRSITRPLAAITGTFKNIKLGTKNEPIFWQHNDEIGLLVNEYNKMLQELEQSANLLARSERESAWRDMAKQVAHEIKNPLTPMRLSIQHLQRALQSDQDNIKPLTERVSRTLLEQIDNLSFIASEFSNFAVMPKTQNESVCLNEIIENVTALFNETAHVNLETHLVSEHLFVWADKNQMIRVFNNILKNALQAIPDDKNGNIVIELEHTDDKASISISDNGAGIPESYRDKVFVPNFTTKSSGMGIGLAITKNIVESANGFIWFESEEDKGTTFYIELPLMKMAAE
ncbi:MAG: HAMP domain-containing sensor histidine kinase [Chitinophagales bacterium]|nr:HAMP domain-containing histidine kinase [Bacteroidota bacterium]MBK8488625.1 HAMP domain-containing histidine kinase [Bacteroidota bacterium]MBK8681614.1 HAMP domain-containing histidine kinase [Bacteroidota bacterium]